MDYPVTCHLCEGMADFYDTEECSECTNTVCSSCVNEGLCKECEENYANKEK